MAYVIIVEFLAKPDKVEAFAELIDRHAHNSRTLEDGCLAFDVCQDPQDPGRFVFYEAYGDQAAHRQNLETDSFKWFRATAPDLIRPAPKAPCPTTLRC
jgi:autoinducer 2-degrading protein